MQATVASYDSDTGAGTVLRDDGVLLGFAGAALGGAQLRHLRLGQRVTIELAPDAETVSVLRLR